MSEEIGPQIPAHFLSKIGVINNEDDNASPEIEPSLGSDLTEFRQDRTLDQDSEVPESVTIGPMIPQERVQIGPQIPSSSIGEHNMKDEDNDRKLRNSLPAISEGTSSHKKRVIGPAMMPPPEYSNYQEYETEEEIVGPVLPKDFNEGNDDNGLLKTIREFEERAERMRKTLESNEQGDKPLQRGEWMLVPPETKFLGETPTNMRSRQFKKRAVNPNDNDNSLWTETPAEREERLKKQATSTQKRKHVKDNEDDEPIKYSRVDLETSEKINEYNSIYRSKTLLETHAESYVKSRKWKEDDASKRPFDREKDVLGTRRMDLRKRQEFLDNAKGLSSKFGHGKHGSN
ncbi:13709_t:CDS:2 [Funneliformis geosporum]|uniref:13709_t:CDS:1 n=1 Tax=Funneliformis geosporum TaxID=1117311 RepID=A0A9W4WSS6_9GLOM|nr:13709_t:CDS:2 [Funneliformis geosporum]